MKNLKNKNILLLWLLPVLILMGYLLYSGLNFGVDYVSSNVVTFTTKDDHSIDEVAGVIKSEKNFSRINSMEGNVFQVFFQNVDIEDLKSMEDSISAELGELSDFQVMIYKPTTIIFITERIVYALYVGVLIYIAFLAFQLKGSGITREKLLWFLLTEFLVLVSGILLILGTINILSVIGVQITATVILFTLAILIYAISFNVFLTRGMSFKSSQIVPEVVEMSNRFHRNYLRYYALLGLLVVSLLFVQVELLTLIILSIVTTSYFMLLFLRIKPLMLEWFISNAQQRNPFSKSKFFSKEW